LSLAFRENLQNEKAQEEPGTPHPQPRLTMKIFRLLEARKRRTLCRWLSLSHDGNVGQWYSSGRVEMPVVTKRQRSHVGLLVLLVLDADWRSAARCQHWRALCWEC